MTKAIMLKIFFRVIDGYACLRLFPLVSVRRHGDIIFAFNGGDLSGVRAILAGYNYVLVQWPGNHNCRARLGGAGDDDVLLGLDCIRKGRRDRDGILLGCLGGLGSGLGGGFGQRQGWELDAGQRAGETGSENERARNQKSQYKSNKGSQYRIFVHGVAIG